MAVENTEALAALLEASINTKEIKTKYVPVPEGITPVLITEFEFKDFPAKVAGELPSLLLSVKCKLLDPEIGKELQQDEVIRRYETWVNRNANGKLEENNIGIGRLMLAAGQYEVGEAPLLEVLNSCVGQQCYALVEHGLYKGAVQDKLKDLISEEEYDA